MVRAFNSKVSNLISHSISQIAAFIILIFSFSMILLGCTNSADNKSFGFPEGEPNPQQKEATNYTANASTRNLLAADDISTIVFTDTVYINLGDGTSSFSIDGNEYTPITAAKKKAAQTVIENVLIYKTSDGVVTLNTEGYTGILKVILSGKIENGSFAMKTSTAYTGLFLDNVDITSAARHLGCGW